MEWSLTDTFRRKFGKARLHTHVVSVWLLKVMPSSAAALIYAIRRAKTHVLF